MPKLLTIWIGIALFSVTSTFVWFATEEKEVKNSPLQSERLNLESKLVAEKFPESKAIQFQPKLNRRYIYNFERKIIIDGGMQAGKPATILYHGDYLVDVFQKSETGFEAIVQQKILETKNQRTHEPIQLRIAVNTKNNKVDIFSTENDTRRFSVEEINLLKDMVSLWLFSSSEDTVGKYTASWEKLSQDSDKRIKQKKIKLAYLGNAQTLPTILRSEHILEWHSQEAIPNKISGEEITQMGEGKMNISARNSYSIHLEKIQSIATMDQKLLAKFTKQEILQLSLAARNIAEDPEYQKITLAKVLQGLREVQNFSDREKVILFGDLVKLLRMHGKYIPELVALLGADILKLGANSELFKTIIGALATVASSEMQAALRAIYQNPNLVESGRGTILAALTTTQANINTQTQDFLIRVLREEKNRSLANGAAFALGASIQNQNSDPAIISKAVQLMERAWERENHGNDFIQKLAVLDAIGNSGRLEFFPLLKNEIQSNPEIAIRARAIFSLRFMPGMEAQQIILQNLGNGEVALREAAVAAIQHAQWSEVYRRPLELCASQDPIVPIQKNCRAILEAAAG